VSTKKQARASAKASVKAKGKAKPKPQPMPKQAKTAKKREPTGFEKLTENVPEEPLGLNEDLLMETRRAEESVQAAVLTVARDVDLAGRLSAPESLPRVRSNEGSWFALDELTRMAIALDDKEVDAQEWPGFVNASGELVVKRGSGSFVPQRRIKAGAFMGWLRGDADVVKPRQANLEGELVAQKDGAEYRVIQRPVHYFATPLYEARLTKGTLARIKSTETTEGERLRILDDKIHLKKEVQEDPGDGTRGEHKRKLIAVILVATIDDAESETEDDDGERDAE